jgi:acetolactate synthase-1/2/3 large subunit
VQGYEVAADAVVKAGVDVFFGLLGNSNLATAGVLAERGVRFAGSRHESGALAMAAGYAWATGRPAFCTVTHGPGLANALTALTTAARDHLPIVLLVGDIKDQASWSAQRAAHAEMVAWTGADFLDCTHPTLIEGTLLDAFRQAVDCRRPVLVNVPAKLLDAPADSQKTTPASPLEACATDEARTPLTRPDHGVSAADGSLIRRAVDLVSTARRPVVLGGRGAIGAGPELRQLAEAMGALLATTLPAKGLFAGDAFDLGVSGGYSTLTARELLREADCLLAFGAGLNGYTTGGGLYLDAKVIHVDLDPGALGRYRKADLAVLGDTAEVARVMTADLARRPPHGGRRSGCRTDALAERVAVARAGGDHPSRSDANGIDPLIFLRRLDSALPADRQVVIDVGHFSTFPSQALTVTETGRFLPAFGFGSVGLALATGLGAAIGRALPTLVVVGDGGLLMSLGELETLSRLGLPVTVVVLNDSAYGAEVHHLRSYGLPETLARFPRCDFAAVAQALGIPADTFTTEADLEDLVAVRTGEGPHLIDVRVTPAAIADRFTSHGGICL